MTCLSTCRPFLPTRCADCPERSQSGSSSTLGEGLPRTTYPIGYPEQDTLFLLPPSSERDRALSLLNEAYNAVAGMPQGRVTSIVKTKIEEAEMWLGKVSP